MNYEDFLNDVPELDGLKDSTFDPVLFDKLVAVTCAILSDYPLIVHTQIDMMSDDEYAEHMLYSAHIRDISTTMNNDYLSRLLTVASAVAIKLRARNRGDEND